MKKRKTYEVSVINKTYSKTYSDETKFYTSDTALELNFQLKEVEYDFDSAEIILLNVDDRSLATRPIAKSADGFTYELEDDIVEHYGEWKGQLKFNEGGEIYVSSPVSFRIENDLTNDRPPQLTEVNTWKNLRVIADGLIADIRSELDLVATKVSEMDSAESERQSAELIRIENENQRETDHANRSAELAGKADKKQEDWITPTFFNGATGSLKYRKNSLGKLEFKGTLLLHNTSKITGIPRIYAPMANTFFTVSSTTLQNYKVAKLDATGGLYFQPPVPSTAFEVDFNGIVINLD